MSNSQAEIKAIQERLRAIRSGQMPSSSASSPSTSSNFAPSASNALMVELFPGSTPAGATPSSTQTLERVELRQRATATQESPARTATRREMVLKEVADREAALREAAHREATSEALLAALRSQHTASRVSEFAPPTERPPSPQQLAQQQIAQQRAEQQRAEQQLAAVRRQLETKAEQINQLSAAQEAALLELKTLAEKLERDRLATQTQSFTPASNPSSPLYEYSSTAIPYIERGENGAFVFKSREVDLFRAEREAALMADRLRQNPTSHSSSSQNSPSQNSSDHSAFERTKLARRRSPSHSSADVVKAIATPLGHFTGLIKQWFDSPKDLDAVREARQRSKAVPMDSVGLAEGVVCLLGATIVRMGIDWMLAAFPQLWLLAIVLIVAPAAIAVYQVTIRPETSVAWGYRLLAIMLGLLLGGRL